VHDRPPLTLDEGDRLLEGELPGRLAVDPHDEVAALDSGLARGSPQGRRHEQAGAGRLDGEADSRIAARRSVPERLVLGPCQIVGVGVAELLEHAVDRLLVEDVGADRAVVRALELLANLDQGR
jgi:hypothetical protein